MSLRPRTLRRLSLVVLACAPVSALVVMPAAASGPLGGGVGPAAPLAAPDSGARVVAIAVDVSDRSVSKKGYDDTDGPAQRWDATVDAIEGWLLDESVSGDLSTRDLSLVVSNYSHDAQTSTWDADVSTRADVKAYVANLRTMPLAQARTYGDRDTFAHQVDAGLDAIAKGLKTLPATQQRACLIHDWDLDPTTPNEHGATGATEGTFQTTDGIGWFDATGHAFGDAADTVGDLTDRLSVLWTIGDYYAGEPDQESREQEQRDFFRYTYAGLTRGTAGTQAEYASHDQLTTDHGRLCFADPVDVQGLEVTQGTQDVRNSVKLVAGRETLARAYVREATGADPTPVTLSVDGTDGTGTALSGGALTVAGDDPATEPAPRVVDPLRARGKLQGRRSPSSFWVPEEWTTTDTTVALAVRASRPIASCASPLWRTVDGTCSTTALEFAEIEPVRLVILQAAWFDHATRIAPTDADSRELARRIERSLPFGELDVKIFEPTRRTTSSERRSPYALLEDLEALRAELQVAADSASTPDTIAARRYYRSLTQDYLAGVDPDRDIFMIHVRGASPDARAGGIANAVGTFGSRRGALAVVYDNDAADRDDATLARTTAAHEVGHVLGLSHPSESPSTALYVAGLTDGPCGEYAGRSFNDIGQAFADVGGKRLPVLGPLDEGLTARVWGIDTDLARRVFDGATDAATQELALRDPDETYALMSYCEPQRWTSAAEWDAALDQLRF